MNDFHPLRIRIFQKFLSIKNIHLIAQYNPLLTFFLAILQLKSYMEKLENSFSVTKIEFISLDFKVFIKKSKTSDFCSESFASWKEYLTTDIVVSKNIKEDDGKRLLYILNLKNFIILLWSIYTYPTWVSICHPLCTLFLFFNDIFYLLMHCVIPHKFSDCGKYL